MFRGKVLVMVNITEGTIAPVCLNLSQFKDGKIYFDQDVNLTATEAKDLIDKLEQALFRLGDK
jgi:hypothetical protein